MNCGEEFQDYLPLMIEKLGEDGLMQELAKGFDLLADPRSQTITFQSLKSNGPMIGLPQMTDCELHRMISEGDSYGRGELDLHDFCVLMVRTSPVLMRMAKVMLHWPEDETNLTNIYYNM
ncbi:hypothetical protein KP509_30G075800 [Ceratopteris richardii]|uniref:EF-hand domain-containing protein n=3 Tax=Ceratopteris richardii TaxID=49495 RepID=A0A8T2R5Q8_CERRI|nr:hypothetical protein KP509_30G075800 [Ceratopteris richardii]